jgi:hypothetical protein
MMFIAFPAKLIKSIAYTPINVKNTNKFLGFDGCEQRFVQLLDDPVV